MTAMCEKLFTFEGEIGGGRFTPVLLFRNLILPLHKFL